MNSPVTYTTPRPIPQFFDEERPTFSTKKKRGSSGYHLPNRPAAKSAPPISRIFPHRPMSEKPKPISFKSRSDNSLSMSKHYNERNRDLYFDQCFSIEAKLGEGSFGEVFKVKSKEDGMLYAIKRGREKFRNASDRLAKLSEVQKHETLPKHMNVVEFIQAWEERGCLYIQTELCQTSLSNYAELHHDIPEATVWNFFVDLLLAVKHLHDHELIHLDIKPDNIFISRNGICKLGDFGLVYDLNRVGISDAQEGDAKYLAPEILNDVIGKSNDIFSLGVTLLELACDLDLPSHGESWQLIRQGRLPDDLLHQLSPELQRLIRLMLHPDYKNRPSVDQLLRLPSVQRVMRRRRYAFYYSQMVDTFRGIFAVAWLYVTLVITSLLGRPLQYVSMKLHNGGIAQQRYRRACLVDPVAKPLNFEEFSDDDVNEISSIHNCSTLGESLGSSGGDLVSPMSSDAAQHPWNSTPAQIPSQRRTVLFESPPTNTSTPSDPTHNSTLGRSGHNSTVPASFHSSLFNSNSRSAAQLQPNRPVRPKNLLDEFEGTSSDDE